MSVGINTPWKHVSSSGIDNACSARYDEVAPKLADDAIFNVDVHILSIVGVYYFTVFYEQTILGALKK